MLSVISESLKVFEILTPIIIIVIINVMPRFQTKSKNNDDSQKVCKIEV